MRRRSILAVLVLSGLALAAARQDPTPPPVDPLTRPFDEILDAYVRDGFVYYGALRQERPKFDRYVETISAVPADTLAGWTPERQLAFWINAYNAFVLQTVIDHYPIRGVSPLYPADSVRQIPGAFESRRFRIGGRTLTLDAMEKDVIEGFRDARALLALGRGSIGGGRLKSEAYNGERLDGQLASMTSEIVTRREMVMVDTGGNQLSVSPMFSWRETIFDTQLADHAAPVYATRSPIERAVLALIDPLVTPLEAEFLRQNQFRMVFHDFDWRLNDLATRPR